MNLKRQLFLLHRWLGVIMCLFFALWFASGVIMMYVEYPELTEQERLDMLPALRVGDAAVAVEQAVELAGMTQPPVELRLTSVAGRPAYLMRAEEGRLHAIFADTGKAVESSSPQIALATVRSSRFVAANTAVEYDALIQDDQWTVSSGLHEHRPLHRVKVHDDAGTVLYVSSRTGQIVRDTHRSERLWNWLGSTIHWIYPVQLRRHGSLWADIVIYLSLAGVVSVVTGTVVGIMRWRPKKKYKNGAMSPYQGVAKWHHVLGLIGAAFVGTFVFSGLMSMSPWGLFESKADVETQIERYRGGAHLLLHRFPLVSAEHLPMGVKEVEWVQIASQGHLVISTAAQRQVQLADLATPLSQPQALHEAIRKSAALMLPDARVESMQTLTAYDNYYYSRHNRYRPLPVYLIKFDDAESTWYYIDRNTGQVVTRYTEASRLARWLYNGLHSLDFAFLTKKGLLWDITVIVLSIVGFVFSVTSVIVGWRRLSKKLS